MVQSIPGKDRGSGGREFKTDHNVSGWGNSVNKVKKNSEKVPKGNWVFKTDPSLTFAKTILIFFFPFYLPLLGTLF